MDDGAQLVEGLKVSQVETVLPRQPGAPVLVVGGRYKLRKGRLVERRTKEARVVLQLIGDFELVECGFDDVAEWADPADELDE